MQQNDYLQVGVITSTHGIKGEVKVFPTTDDPNRFRALKDVVLDTGKEQIPLEIEGVKFFKQYVILKFKGIDNINDIEKYRKMPLLVSRENAVELEEDEYYMADIIGMDVYTEDGEKFGVLEDIMETGANDVYVVSTEAHTEVLLPAIHDCILDVDTENRNLPVVPDLRSGILRIFQEIVLKTLKFGRYIIMQNTRDQAGYRIHDHHCRKFTACQYIIAG